MHWTRSLWPQYTQKHPNLSSCQHQEMPILHWDLPGWIPVTPSLQQLWDLSFKFTFTGFSSPHPPSSTRWCPWTRKLLSQNTWLIPHSPAIGGCRTALASLQFLPKLLDSSSGQAAHGKEKGWLWNTSAKAQVFTIKDKSEFCSTCLWKFESSTSCYEIPWLETQVADLLCTHYIYYTGEKYLLN